MDAFGRNRVVPDRLGTVPQIVDINTFSEKAGDQSKIYGADGSETVPATMVPCAGLNLSEAQL